MFSKGTKQ
ncbi:MAG: hypothetical protein GTO40_01540, partial [Deltaproteobacteria bacterium]|nr:hypothetical protein [Deltaproteobacteria bacterium]